MNIAAAGVSPDGLAALKKFREKLSLNFPLLSDPDHKVAEVYGVWGEKTMYGKKAWGIIRSVFLIDEAGMVLGAWYRIAPGETTLNVLNAVEAICASGTDCQEKGSS